METIKLKKESKKERSFISLIIYCINSEDVKTRLENLIKSINYDKNNYELIILCNQEDEKSISKLSINKIIKINKNFDIAKNLDLSFKYLDEKTKYIGIYDNNTLFSPNTIYDKIKILSQNSIDSVYCLANYQNYKDNFINNIYYHYKYLENQINYQTILDRFIKRESINNIKIANILHKNLITKNLPRVWNMGNEIYFFNKINSDYFYIYEIFLYLASLVLLNFAIYPLIIMIINIWFYYYQINEINFGINDFNFFQSIYLTFLKILNIPILLFHFISCNYFNKLSYKSIKSNNFIKPEIGKKEKFDNGYKYSIKNYNLDIISLKGDDYQMGLTLGKIYKKELNEYLKILDQIIPPFAVNPLWKGSGYKARTILTEIKNYSWDQVSEENKQELKGISTGSGINLEEIILLSLFPCIFKAHCTLVTDKNFFLRTLDVDFKNERACIIIYNQPNKIKYVTLTAPGMNWCVTGFSEKIMLGEVFNDYCKVSKNKNGCPFFFNFKDILKDSNNLEEAKNIINSKNWNDSIDIAVSSISQDKNYFIEKRGNESIYYDNNNFNDYLKKYSKSNINNYDKFSFYYNLDLMYRIINQYDNLSAEDLYNSIIIGLETGSNHSLIIDKSSKKMYFSTANSELEGYLRQMVVFDLDWIFSI